MSFAANLSFNGSVNKSIMQSEDVQGENIKSEQKDTSFDREAALIEYLRANPDFFLRHQSLLAELNLPHGSGRTISLVEHQVAILRERNVDMRRRMNELVHTARENEELFRKIRVLTLALLTSKTLQELNEVLATHVLVDFDADFVCCHVLSTAVTGVDHRAYDHFRAHGEKLPLAHLAPADDPVCTTLREEELGLLFPLSDHASSGSAALIPLTLNVRSDVPDGMLCIGARDAQHFSADMDTLFVSYIAEVLSKVLGRLIQ
jgi:uncharacterized protein YigA (DUF484 family)